MFEFANKLIDAWKSQMLKDKLLKLGREGSQWPENIESFRWRGAIKVRSNEFNVFGRADEYEVGLHGSERPIILRFAHMDDIPLVFLTGRPAFKNELNKSANDFGQTFVPFAKKVFGHEP